MDEPQRNRSIADDPDFLADLDELDRGLGPARDRQTRVRKPAATLEPATRSPTASPFLAASEIPIIAQPGSRRPLLDLFPPVPTGPPDLARGLAAAPNMPGSPRRLSLAPPAPAAEGARSYETFYGLTESPFALAADVRFVYHSTEHDRAAQQLRDAIARRDGVVLLTAPTGMGKTLLCRAIVEQLDRRTVTSFVHEPVSSTRELFERILADLGVVSAEDLAQRGGGVDELRGTLRSFVASLAPLQANALVILDDAQNAGAEVLADLHRLADAAGPLQIVLVGDPALLRLLKRSELHALHHAVTTRIDLGPLAADEVPGYVMHRLHIAGESPRVDFDDPALALIFEVTAGVPRPVNQVCDRALARAFAASAAAVDAPIVAAAAADLGVVPPVSAATVATRAIVIAIVVLALASAGATGAAWVFRNRLRQAIAGWEAPPPAPPPPSFAVPPQASPLPPPPL